MLLKNKKQLYYCINVIKNRILILLNIINKYERDFSRYNKTLNKTFR